MSADLPPGYVLVPVRTTHLEMLRNEVQVAPQPPAGWRVERWLRPAPDAYRDLFTAVGGEWGWTGSLLMTEHELAELLRDDRVEVWRLLSGDTAAGFVELDRRVPGEAEIVYFGLLREFIGRGLGGFLLRWTIHHAWTSPAADDAPGAGAGAGPTKRLWLHTCEYDHSGALAVYLKAGFRVFHEESGLEAYPEAHVRRLNSEAAGTAG